LTNFPALPTATITASRLATGTLSLQTDAIETALESHAQQGILRYGVHRSDSALMTCLVFNLDNSEHIHFVDGSDGGFTAAAKNMKAK
jgi:hypothetical protein